MSDPDDSIIQRAGQSAKRGLLDRENLYILFLALLYIEVYDIWPDQDFDPEHVQSVLHWLEDHAQYGLAFLSLIGAIALKLIEVWGKKK